VLAALEALAPAAGTETAEEVRKALGYFTTNASRMDYPRFLARQVPIGSGAVECACKTLVQARAKQAGLRWSRAGVQAVLSLRAVHRSGRWDQFWQTRPQRRRPAVFPRRGALVSFPDQADPPAIPDSSDQQAAYSHNSEAHPYLGLLKLACALMWYHRVPGRP
ncbi:MAG: hypothetical protein H0V51_20550, partial [Chloroflexi bacterium]|nr:hypothetical protein [Chloroflexota bacterium]